MKKKILLAFVFIIGLFFSLTPVNALTKITFDEISNGQIDTKLHFEDGFVGAIDVTFNISGNVDVKNFKFSNKVNSDDYDKEFIYNKSKHTLTVRVTTGGIGTSHNLLNSKKELELGVIEFSTTSKDDVNYKLSETAFKIVGNSWESKTIEQSHITLGDTTSFVYKVEKVEEEDPTDPETPENPETPDEPGDDTEENSGNNTESNNDKSEVTNNGSTAQNNQSQSGNNQKPNSNGTTKPNENQTDDDLENNEPSDEVNQEENDSNQEANENNKEEKNSGFDWPIIIVSIIALLLVIGLGFYFLVFKKRKED